MTTPVPTLFIYVQVDQWKVYWRSKKRIFTKIDEANFKKSLDYGIDKLGFGMFESTFSFCENLLNLLIGLSPLLWDTATYYATSYGLVNKDSSLVYTEIIQSAPFLGVVQIINEVIYVSMSACVVFCGRSYRGGAD